MKEQLKELNDQIQSVVAKKEVIIKEAYFEALENANKNYEMGLITISELMTQIRDISMEYHNTLLIETQIVAS